jgi:hypothetical protein
MIGVGPGSICASSGAAGADIGPKSLIVDLSGMSSRANLAGALPAGRVMVMGAEGVLAFKTGRTVW